MLIRLVLNNREPAALTDEPSVLLEYRAAMPVIGLMEAGKDVGGLWPNGTWILETEPEQMEALRQMLSVCGTDEPISIRELCTAVPFAEESFFMRAADRFYKRPWKIAETERLLIRELCVEDAEALMKMYADAEIKRYMEPLPEAESEVRELIAAYVHYMYELTGFGIWGIVKKSDGKLIGRVGFEPESEGEGIALGYLLCAGERKKGYALEACQAALEYAERELEVPRKEIRCHIAPDNAASRKLAEKLGITICFG